MCVCVCVREEKGRVGGDSKMDGEGKRTAGGVVERESRREGEDDGTRIVSTILIFTLRGD